MAALFEETQYQRSEWRSFIVNRSINTIWDLQDKQEELIFHMGNELRQKSYRNNDLLNLGDSVFQVNHERLETLYNESLDAEMYFDKYTDALNNYYRYGKTVESEIRILTDQRKIYQPERFNGLIGGFAEVTVESFLQDAMIAARNNAQIESELKVLESAWKKTLKLSEKQAELQEEKWLFIEKNLTTSQLREENTIEMINNDISAWKSNLRK